MNNEPDVIDDIDLESQDSDEQHRPFDEGRASDRDEGSDDALGDSQLGQDLGELLTEIRRDEENFQQSGESAGGGVESDPFDPSDFSLDTSSDAEAGAPAAASSTESQERGEMPEHETAADTMETEGAGGHEAASAIAPTAAASTESDAAASTISQLVSEIETALQRFTDAERLRADQRIATKEAEVAEQYRKVKALADKVAKQKVQIQEAKKELKTKLELADRLHIEFDGIRQVLNGKLGILEQLDKEDEAAE